MDTKAFYSEMAREFFQRALEAQSPRVRDFFVNEALKVTKAWGVEVPYIKNAAAQLGIK